jgi:hypothetical protein
MFQGSFTFREVIKQKQRKYFFQTWNPLGALTIVETKNQEWDREMKATKIMLFFVI